MLAFQRRTSILTTIYGLYFSHHCTHINFFQAQHYLYSCLVILHSLTPPLLFCHLAIWGLAYQLLTAVLQKVLNLPCTFRPDFPYYIYLLPFPSSAYYFPNSKWSFQGLKPRGETKAPKFFFYRAAKLLISFFDFQLG